MTAIGLLGMLLGLAAFAFTEDGSVLESLGGAAFIVGAILFCAGVFMWLWRVMP